MDDDSEEIEFFLFHLVTGIVLQIRQPESYTELNCCALYKARPAKRQKQSQNRDDQHLFKELLMTAKVPFIIIMPLAFRLDVTKRTDMFIKMLGLGSQVQQRKIKLSLRK